MRKPSPHHGRARRGQRGATTLEYIVLGVVLVLGLVAGVAYLRGRINTGLGNLGDDIENTSTQGDEVAPPEGPNG